LYYQTYLIELMWF